MNKEELLKDLAGKPFVSRILTDDFSGKEALGIEVRGLSYQETVGKVSAIRTIAYMVDPETGEAWYVEQEPVQQIKA